MHALSFSAVTRRGPLSACLCTRPSFAARELDSERLQLIWHQLPFGDFRLRVNMQTVRAPGVVLTQTSVALSGNWPKRVYFSIGVKQSFFKWNTSHNPTWQARTRPHIDLHYTAPAGWSVEMKIDEIIDDFPHLRTTRTRTQDAGGDRRFRPQVLLLQTHRPKRHGRAVDREF